MKVTFNPDKKVVETIAWIISDWLLVGCTFSFIIIRLGRQKMERTNRKCSLLFIYYHLPTAKTFNDCFQKMNYAIFSLQNKAFLEKISVKDISDKLLKWKMCKNSQYSTWNRRTTPNMIVWLLKNGNISLQKCDIWSILCLVFIHQAF